MDALVVSPTPTLLSGSYQFISLLRRSADLPREIIDGLCRWPKQISPKYFYDENGAQLFEKITTTEEYYPTRAEQELLRTHATDIAEVVVNDCVLIEPGCGSCSKVQILLPHIRPAAYIPIDISAQALQKSGQRLAYRFPWLNCTAIGADFADLSFLPTLLPNRPRVVFYPGSTIGNFEPVAAIEFLKMVRTLVGPEGGLLIGVDLKKDSALLNRAYNDKDGITAEFNLNILHHINRVIGSNFDSTKFEHVAFYNEDQSRIEMHLRSRCRQIVAWPGGKIGLEEGERIHTENSYKYSTESFSSLAAEAGFVRAKSWYDTDKLFSLHYFVSNNVSHSH